MKNIQRTLVAAAALLAAVTAAAQTDSAAVMKQIEAQNAAALRAFAAHPKVVGKKTVPRKDFYLYYNHIDWCKVGNAVVSPVEDKPEFYFVQNDDVVFTEQVDGKLWSAPEAPSPLFEGAGEDAFPTVTYNGKVLYFSSKDLYGIGGYDIYRCERNPLTGELGEPQNMGYPFNSTADDILCSETPDGKYVMFASNRDCSPSEITIYIVEYENYTRKEASAQEIAELGRLTPSSSASFVFNKNAAVNNLDIEFEEPESDYDYTFRVGAEGSFAEDNSLPDGIVYQIQLFVTSTKATVKQIRGLSPVFERRQSSGKYLYTAGLFRTYKEAEAALPKVRKAGFSSAYVVAYDNGKSIAVKTARTKEQSIKVVDEQVHIVK